MCLDRYYHTRSRNCISANQKKQLFNRNNIKKTKTLLNGNALIINTNNNSKKKRLTDSSEYIDDES